MLITQWDKKTLPLARIGLVIYTSRSKMANGVGAGIYRERPKMNVSISLRKGTTINQAEVHTIHASIKQNIML